MQIDDSAFPKYLMFNGLIGLGYFAICSNQKWLDYEVLYSQGTQFAFSTTVQMAIQPTTTDGSLSAKDLFPVAIMFAGKAFTDIAWKPHLFSVAVLGGSQVVVGKTVNWYKEDKPGGGGPLPPLPPGPKPGGKPNPGGGRPNPGGGRPDPIRGVMTTLNEATIDTTTIQIVTGDILDAPVEAIVNAANTVMLGGGGIDGAIHRAAGSGLRQECERFPTIDGTNRIHTGEALVTGSHNIEQRNPQIKHIVHTAGPSGTTPDRRRLLENAYRNSLIAAHGAGIRSVAFPAISVGIFGYPVQEGIEVGITTVKEYVEGNPGHFDLICFDYLPDAGEHITTAIDVWQRNF